MLFEISDRTKDLQERLNAFMDRYIYPSEEEYYRQLNEGDRWQVIPLVEKLKKKARAAIGTRITTGCMIGLNGAA